MLARARKPRRASQRDFARRQRVPRSTLRSWERRDERIAPHEDPHLRAFLRSPAGLRALHRILLAALLTFCLSAGCGVATVRGFLTLAGLAPFLACSESTLRRTLRSMVGHTGTWGDNERTRLVPQMAPRRITLAPDETTRGEQLLVAAELPSNFLLVEKASARRDSGTWAQAVREALAGAPVVIEQVTADEARGLGALAAEVLGAHKTSDLMHGQQDIHRATAAPLAALVREAEKAHLEAAQRVQAEQSAAADWAKAPHGPGRPPDWVARSARAEAAERHAGAALESAIEHQVGVRLCVRDLGQGLHPVDVQTGKVPSVAEVAAKLNGIFEELWQRVIECGLGERRWKLLAKAKRLVPSWLGSLAW